MYITKRYDLNHSSKIPAGFSEECFLLKFHFL